MKFPLLRLPQLSNLERLELEHALKEHAVKFEEVTDRGGKHGDLSTTTAVVVISLATLRVLAIWLTRKIDQGWVTKILEIEDANGSRRSETIKLKLAKGEAGSEAVLKELAGVCDVKGTLTDAGDK